MNELILLRGIERLLIVSSVPLLVWIGYKLFVLGATGQMTLSAKSTSIQGKITNLSPGCFCFLAAAALAAYAIHAPFHYTDSTNSVGNQSRGTPTSSGQTQTVDYVGGAPANHLRPSVIIRTALSDLLICQQGKADASTCYAQMNKTLRRIPNTSEMAALENSESHPETAEAQAILQQMRGDFLMETSK